MSELPATSRGAGVDTVVLRIPAEAAYVSVVRTATAGLAARLDMTLDDIEDLRIAVDEACALLLADAHVASDLTCTFTVADSSLTIDVEAPTRSGKAPAQDTFAWTVLTALAGDVTAEAKNGVVRISLSRKRTGA